MSTDAAEVELGSAAPDFSLESNDGSLIRLSEFKGQKNVVLYFMREFMCLSCQRHAAQLGRMYSSFQAHDAEVLVIGHGSRKLAEYVSKSLRLPFPVLFDLTRDTYERYDLSKILMAIQRSGTFLIDKQGVVRYIHQATNPQSSVDEAELMAELEKLQPASPASASPSPTA